MAAIYVRESDMDFFSSWQFWVSGIVWIPLTAAVALGWAMFNKRRLNKWRGEVSDDLKRKRW